MRLTDLCQKIMDGFPDDVRKDIRPITMEGLIIGLRKRRIGYEQVFIAGGNNKYATIFSTSKRYGQEISDIAKELEINYIERGRAPVAFLGKKAWSLYIHPYPLGDFKQYIKEQREKDNSGSQKV